MPRHTLAGQVRLRSGKRAPLGIHRNRNTILVAERGKDGVVRMVEKSLISWKTENETRV